MADIFGILSTNESLAVGIASATTATGIVATATGIVVSLITWFYNKKRDKLNGLFQLTDI